jgi:hypothetical protein
MKRISFLILLVIGLSCFLPPGGATAAYDNQDNVLSITNAPELPSYEITITQPAIVLSIGISPADGYTVSVADTEPVVLNASIEEDTYNYVVPLTGLTGEIYIVNSLMLHHATDIGYRCASETFYFTYTLAGSNGLPYKILHDPGDRC